MRNNSTSDPFSLLQSQMNGLCLRVENGATMAKCDTNDPFQQMTLQGHAITTPHHDDNQCLTGLHSTETHGDEWHSFGSSKELERAVEDLFPDGVQSGLSLNYKKAYATSDQWIKRSQARRLRVAEEQCPREQCPKGLGAPQGPGGEVYTTHSTISSFTWRFVVGVQLSRDFNVTSNHVGLGSQTTNGVSYVSYAWSDQATFKPWSLLAFSADSPIQLHNSTSGICNTGHGDMSVNTECFPFQWHVIAPVLPNGWVVTGEVGKLMPISRQRIQELVHTSGSVKLSLIGAPGEEVEMGAARQSAEGVSFTPPIYKTCTIQSDGTGVLRFP